MQKKFNVVINGKGGVGKSFFVVNFAQFLKDNGIAHTAVDTGDENSTLKRFHPKATFLDIEDPTEIDAVFAALDKVDLVVMDCRAASTDIFLDYFEEVRIFDLLKSISYYFRFSRMIRIGVVCALTTRACIVNGSMTALFIADVTRSSTCSADSKVIAVCFYDSVSSASYSQALLFWHSALRLYALVLTRSKFT